MTISVPTEYIVESLLAHSALMSNSDPAFRGYSLLNRDSIPMLEVIIRDAFLELTASMASKSYVCTTSSDERMLIVEAPAYAETFHPGAAALHLANAVTMMTLHLITRAADEERKARDYLTHARGAWKELVRTLKGCSNIAHIKMRRY